MSLYFQGVARMALFKTLAVRKVLAAIDEQWREEEFYGGLVARATGLLEGSVYTILSRLRREGLLVSRIRPMRGTPPRCYYRLTDEGQRYLDSVGPIAVEWRATTPSPTQLAQLPEEFNSYGFVFTQPFLRLCGVLLGLESEEFCGNDLPAQAGMVRATVASALGRMQARGLVEVTRRRNGTSGHLLSRVYYRVTPAGEAFLQSIAYKLAPEG